jgi:hypothetical protein
LTPAGRSETTTRYVDVNPYGVTLALASGVLEVRPEGIFGVADILSSARTTIWRYAGST